MKISMTLLCSMLIATMAHAETFKDTRGKHLDILREGKPVLRYMYEFDNSTKEKAFQTYKVFYHLMDEKGTDTITKGAGYLFPHHRGIFIGWNKLSCNGVTSDLWHMSKGAVQKHRKFIERKSEGNKTTLATQIDWLAAGGKNTIVEEVRTVTLLDADDAHLLLDVISELKAVGGDIMLHGDPEHAGLQYRAHQDVAKNKSTKYTFHKEGVDPKKDLDLPWATGTYDLRGKKYSVQHMNHPDNPKGGRYSAYRDYGRFGCFPRSEISKGETLTLKYRIRVTLGDVPSVDEMNKRYSEFVRK